MRKYRVGATDVHGPHGPARICTGSRVWRTGGTGGRAATVSHGFSRATVRLLTGTPGFPRQPRRITATKENHDQLGAGRTREARERCPRSGRGPVYIMRPSALGQRPPATPRLVPPEPPTCLVPHAPERGLFAHGPVSGRLWFRDDVPRAHSTVGTPAAAAASLEKPTARRRRGCWDY